MSQDHASVNYCEQNKILKILLAEDNLINQEVVIDMIEALGHHIDAVENGKEALDAVLKRTYDMVFMDCRMPVMDGYEATKCIRQYEQDHGNNNPVPIIAFTANAMSSDIDKCKNAGMDDFVSKPFTMDELETVVLNWKS